MGKWFCHGFLSFFMIVDSVVYSVKSFVVHGSWFMHGLWLVAKTADAG